MSDRVLLAAVVSLVLVGAADQLVAAKEQSAVAYVESIYADRSSPDGPARYSPRLQKLWDECEATAKKNGDACMDFSVIVMGNDALLTDVTVKLIQGGAKLAVVDAHFKNLGKPTTVTYDLRRDKDGWMIDEMRSGCYVLSRALKGELPSC
jgi:predicted acylesterase/phospholipase RssA